MNLAKCGSGATSMQANILLTYKFIEYIGHIQGSIVHLSTYQLFMFNDDFEIIQRSLGLGAVIRSLISYCHRAG